MFRLFLRSKILSADSSSESRNTAAARSAAADAMRNRRVFQRFPIDHKHLTLMNDQDILLVREVSAKGFSTEVAPRTIERLVEGDVYEGRIRYLKETYDLKARVAWKASPMIGFEIVDCPADTLVFIKRLIRPMEIAFSLKEVDANFLSAGEDGKRWFHGDHNSDLYIWQDPAGSGLSAWQLNFERSYVEWRSGSGLATGAFRELAARDGTTSGGFGGRNAEPDQTPNRDKRLFATDVIMAMPELDTSAALLSTLE